MRLGAVLLAVVVALIAHRADRRSRAGAAGARRARRLEVPPAAAAHRPALGAARSRHVRLRRPDDRGADAGRPSVPDREADHRRLPWWTIATRKLIVESVDMTDWHMVVETFPNGRHNFPKVTPSGRRRAGPEPLHHDGHAPSMRRAASSPTRITARRGAPSAGTSTSRCTAATSPTTTAAARRSRTAPSRSRATSRSAPPCTRASRSPTARSIFDRIDLDERRRDLGRSTATSISRRWPEQIYRIKSHIDFPTQKDIFFHRDRFTASGQGDFQGTFHLFKGGRELKGTFTSPMAA